MDSSKGNDTLSKCLNCAAEINPEMDYCYKCGAHQSRNRLTTREIFSELFDVIIIWNKDFLKTFLHLLVKPAKTIRYYIDGGRKRYLNPLLYMLFSFFLYLLVISFTGDDLFFISGMEGFSSGVNEGSVETNTEYITAPGEDTETGILNSEAIAKLDNLSKVLFFLMLPIIAYFSRLIFMKLKLNYAEHLVINAFLISQIIIIGIILLPFTLLGESSSGIFKYISVILIITYIIIYQFQIFKENILLSLIRSLGFITLSFISIMTVYMIIAFIVGLVF